MTDVTEVKGYTNENSDTYFGGGGSDDDDSSSDDSDDRNDEYVRIV